MGSLQPNEGMPVYLAYVNDQLQAVKSSAVGAAMLINKHLDDVAAGTSTEALEEVKWKISVWHTRHEGEMTWAFSIGRRVNMRDLHDLEEGVSNYHLDQLKRIVGGR